MLTTISPEALQVQGPDRAASDVGEAWAQAHRMLREALSAPSVAEVIVMVGTPGAGKSTWVKAQPHDPAKVAFDAVFADRARRVAIAKRIHAAGKRAVAVWVVTPLAECRARNNERPAWRKVPDPFLHRCATQLSLAPPTTLEGWDAVLRVLSSAPAVTI